MLLIVRHYHERQMTEIGHLPRPEAAPRIERDSEIVEIRKSRWFASRGELILVHSSATYVKVTEGTELRKRTFKSSPLRDCLHADGVSADGTQPWTKITEAFQDCARYGMLVYNQCRYMFAEGGTSKTSIDWGSP